VFDAINTLAMVSGGAQVECSNDNITDVPVQLREQHSWSHRF